MSSFDNFYNRLQSINEARKSPVEALVPGATGVTKQMRSAGLSSAPLDTIRFIRELLFNLDVISEDQLNFIKTGKGFTGKKQAMLKVLQDNQDAINAKSDEIAQTIESTLDNFINGMGANRSREEKYAAQAAAQELAAQARAAKSGKEMDDALADVISDEKLIIKASLAKAIQELEDLPGGEDISPAVLDEIKKFAPKINTIEQLESFVKQLSGMEEYQLPAAYLSSTVKAIKGGMEDIEMEDQEDPDHGFDAEKSDLDDDGKISEYERKRGEAIASSMGKDDHAEDGEYVTQTQVEAGDRLSAMYRKDMLAEIDKMHKSMVDDGVDPTTGSKFSEAEVSDLYRQAAERNLSKYKYLNKHSNGKQQDRVDVAQSILDDVNKTQADNVRPRNVRPREDNEGISVEEVYPDDQAELPDDYHEDKDYEDAADGAMAGIKAKERLNYIDNIVSTYEGKDLDWYKKVLFKNPKFKDGELTPYELHVLKRAMSSENEEVVAENKYTTADYLTDMYDSVKPIVESKIDENGVTTPTQQYLVEYAEHAIEQAYTSQYLIEQKAEDSLPKQKKEKSLSFKERYQPKTHWQLEEVRRYGL